MAYLYTRYLKEKAGTCATCRLQTEETEVVRKPAEAEEAARSEGETFLARDQEYFRNFYPLRIRRMKDYVQEELEAVGWQSFLGDEYPDRERMNRARDRIFRKMQDDSVEEVLRYEAFSKDVVETLLYQAIIELRSRRY